MFYWPHSHTLGNRLQYTPQTNNTHVRLLKMLDHVKNDKSDKLGEKQQEGR